MREYFLEDIIQLLNFQQINSMTRKQNNKNKQIQDDDDEQGYEDSQTDDIEVNSLSTNIKLCLFIKRILIIIQFVVQNIHVKLHQQ